MTLRKIVDIINNQLILTLPESFRGKKNVLVIVDDSIETRKEKINQFIIGIIEKVIFYWHI